MQWRYSGDAARDTGEMQWAADHDPKLERAERVRVQVVAPQLERLEQFGRRLVELRQRRRGGAIVVVRSKQERAVRQRGYSGGKEQAREGDGATTTSGREEESGTERAEGACTTSP